MIPRRGRSESALVTVGRRAATRSASTEWVRRSGSSDAVAADASPAPGEVPEQHVQPVVDAGLVDDRHVHDQAARAPDRALEQAAAELRVATELAREPPVEDREPDRLEHRPSRRQRERLRRPRPATGATTSHSPSSSTAKRPSIGNAAEHQPLEHEEADAVGRQRWRRAPRPPVGEADLRRHAVLDRLLAPVGRNGLGEVGVLDEDMAKAWSAWI